MTRQPGLFPAKSGLPRALEADFARFWAAYPPRTPNPRAIAETEFTKAVKAGAAPADLVLASTGYAAEVKRLGTAMEFVVHAATFLRQARWRDYLAPALPIGEPVAIAAEPFHPLWPAMRPHMDRSTFAAWIGRCELLELSNTRLQLRAPSSFVAARMRTDFLPLLRRALARDSTFQIILQLPEAS